MNPDALSSADFVFVAVRRGIGAGALAAACAARAARDGDKTALADLRDRPHPALAKPESPPSGNAPPSGHSGNSGDSADPRNSAPFRVATNGGDFEPDETALALADPSPELARARAPVAVVFTYAECDLAAAKLLADKLRDANAPFACVAAVPPRFPFLQILRTRAANELGNANLLEIPELPPDHLAGELAGKPRPDPELAHAIERLAEMFSAENSHPPHPPSVPDSDSPVPSNPDVGDENKPRPSGDEYDSRPDDSPSPEVSAAVAAARRELADVV